MMDGPNACLQHAPMLLEIPAILVIHSFDQSSSIEY